MNRSIACVAMAFSLLCGPVIALAHTLSDRQHEVGRALTRVLENAPRGLKLLTYDELLPTGMQQTYSYYSSDHGLFVTPSHNPKAASDFIAAQTAQNPALETGVLAAQVHGMARALKYFGRIELAKVTPTATPNERQTRRFLEGLGKAMVRHRLDEIYFFPPGKMAMVATRKGARVEIAPDRAGNKREESDEYKSYLFYAVERGKLVESRATRAFENPKYEVEVKTETVANGPPSTYVTLRGSNPGDGTAEEMRIKDGKIITDDENSPATNEQIRTFRDSVGKLTPDESARLEKKSQWGTVNRHVIEQALEVLARMPNGFFNLVLTNDSPLHEGKNRFVKGYIVSKLDDRYTVRFDDRPTDNLRTTLDYKKHTAAHALGKSLATFLFGDKDEGLVAGDSDLLGETGDTPKITYTQEEVDKLAGKQRAFPSEKAMARELAKFGQDGLTAYFFEFEPFAGAAWLHARLGTPRQQRRPPHYVTKATGEAIKVGRKKNGEREYTFEKASLELVSVRQRPRIGAKSFTGKVQLPFFSGKQK